MCLEGMSGAPVLVDSGAKQAAVGLIRWNPTKPDDPEALAVGGMVYACPVKPLTEGLSAYGVQWITRRAIADLVLQYPFPKVSDADCYALLGVWRSEYVDRYQAEGKMPPYAVGGPLPCRVFQGPEKRPVWIARVVGGSLVIVDSLQGQRMGRHIPDFGTFAKDSQVDYALASLEVAHAQAAELLAPELVVKKGC